jgi:hypothetical protein
MQVKRLVALPLLFALGACATTGGGSVAGGECKFLERPTYAVRGVRQYDQDWIDSTVEGGVGACKWARPAARPAELDAKPPKVAKVPAKHPRRKFFQALRSVWPAKQVAPVAATPEPEAAPMLTPLPAEPDAPAPRSAIDELLLVK